MKCLKCGAEIPDQSPICPECGEIIDAFGEEEETEVVEQPIQETQEEAPVEDVPAEEKSSKKKKNKKKKNNEKDEPVSEKEETVPSRKEKSYELEEIQARRLAKKKKEQKKRIFGAICLIVLIVAVAAAGLWAIYEQTVDDKDTTSKPTPSPKATQTTQASQSPEPTQKAEEEILPDVTDAKADISGRTILASKIHINSEDEYYIEFELDNNNYLALINYGTRDDQIMDRYFVVDATPATDHMCKGHVPYIINNIARCGTTDDYIIPDSSSRVLSESDIASLNLRELIIARNEVFARHGRTFNTQMLDEYFKTKSWYKIDTSYHDQLTSIEKANTDLMLKREKSMN